MTDPMREVVDHLGQRFDHLEVVGQGGLCRVYKGTERETGRRVALKVLLPDMREDPEARLRFVREMKLLEQWKHPRIIQAYETHLEPFPWFSMRLLVGFSLADHLDRMGPLPVAEALTIGRDVLEALHFVHQQGYLHRDVKPANILLDDEGRACLADFGLAGQETSSGLTRVGTVMGTMFYLPPEHLAGLPHGIPGDLFSVGLILFECLTGHRYFKLVSKVQHREPAVPVREALGEDVPGELVDAIEVLIQPDPDDRFASAKAAARALKRARKQLRAAGGFEALQELVTLDLLTLGPLEERLRLLARLAPEVRADYLGDPDNLRDLRLHVWEVQRRNVRFEDFTDATTVAGVDAWKLMAAELLGQLGSMITGAHWERVEHVAALTRTTTEALRDKLDWARVRPLATSFAELEARFRRSLHLVLPDREAPVYGFGDLVKVRSWITGWVTRALEACARPGEQPSLYLQHRVDELDWVLEIKGRDLAADADAVRAAVADPRVRVHALEHGGVELRLAALVRLTP